MRRYIYTVLSLDTLADPEFTLKIRQRHPKKSARCIKTRSVDERQCANSRSRKFLQINHTQKKTKTSRKSLQNKQKNYDEVGNTFGKATQNAYT